MLPRIPPVTFAFLASFGFSCLDAQMGYLTNVVEMPVYQLVAMRTAVVCSVFLAYLAKTKPPHAPYGPPGVRGLMWLRGGLVSTGLVCAYTAMHYLTQSEFMTMYCCAPFATGLMCWMFVGERFGRLQVICCCFSLFGVILITNPFRPLHGSSDLRARQIDDRISDTLSGKLIGVSLMMPCLIILGGEMVIMRLIKEQATTAQVMTIISLWPAVSSTLLMVATQTSITFPTTSVAWIVLASIVPIGLLAQLSLTYASQHISGLKVTIAIYSGLVHSTLIQWAVYGNHPGPLAFLGAGIIVVSGLCATIYGPADDSEESDGTRDPIGSSEELERASAPLLDRTEEPTDVSDEEGAASASRH